MELRRRSTASAKKARKEDAAPHIAASKQSDLLPELLHLISDRLSSEDIAYASLSCKSWALHLRTGIKRTQLVVCRPLDDKVSRVQALQSLSKHSPSLTELQLLFSGRSSYGHTAKLVSQLSCLQSLQHLTFHLMVSETPKKGSWPLFFSDSLKLSKLPALTVKGSKMPPTAIMNLLMRLGSSKHNLKQLHLLIGQPNPCSQLPVYSPPQWMQASDYSTACLSTLSGNDIELLVKLTGLQDLAVAMDITVTGEHWKEMLKLKALTSLQVNGLVQHSVLGYLTNLKKLRKLTVNLQLVPGSQGQIKEDCRQLQHVREINIGLKATGFSYTSILHQELQGLASSICSNLRGLSISGFAWSKDTGECLALLTALTSLQLLEVQQAPADGSESCMIDLTPLGKLQDMKRFTAEFFGMQVRFGVLWEEEQQQQQSGTKARRSSRRQSQQQPQQQELPPADLKPGMSGLAKVWPQLQQLRLTGISGVHAAASLWDLKQLTCLTSLSLKCTSAALLASFLLMEMPRQLKDLQLAHAWLLVPKCCTFRDSLTSLSLSNCRFVYPDCQGLPCLLQQLQGLQQLELIDLPQLDNQMLGQAVSALTSLQSLSVVGIGNQQLTHGGLLGLTCLKKLRQLRWHVGDVLDMLPDLTSLAKLKGLVALYIHTALHTQMERWGAYAVLDSLPFCDVHVEAV